MANVGVYSVDEYGARDVLLAADHTIPDYGSDLHFTAMDGPALTDGAVAFKGYYTEPWVQRHIGIYQTDLDGAAPIVIAADDTQIPGGFGTFSRNELSHGLHALTGLEDPSGGGGHFAFFGAGGTPTEFFEDKDFTADEILDFSHLEYAFYLEQQGIYSFAASDPTLAVVADIFTAVPGSATDHFSSFGDKPDVFGDVVVFHAHTHQRADGIYVRDSAGIRAVALEGDTVPGGGDTFTVVLHPSTDGTWVTFLGLTAGGHRAVYKANVATGVVEQAVGVGDALDGAWVQRVTVGRFSTGAGVLAFKATLDDGSFGVYKLGL